MIELEQLVTIHSGGTPSKKEESYWDGDIPWVSAKDLKSFFLSTSEDKVTLSGAKNGTRIAKKNSLFVLVRGMTLLKDVPVCFATRDMAFNQDVKALVATGADPTFLGYFLASQKKQLLSLVNVSGHGTGCLQTDLLEALPVLVPPLPEQVGIGQFLTNWDRTIELTHQLIAAKQERRAWLMQQLLTGKRRLPGFTETWRTMTIGDVTVESSQRNQSQMGADAVRAVNKNAGMIPMKAHVMADDLSRYKIIKPNWFAYNPMRLNIGSICQWNGEDDALVSPDYVVFRCREELIDHRFFNAFRQARRWKSFMDAAGNGSVRVRIYFDDLARMPLKLPSMQEQRRIADVINLADREIVLMQVRLEETQQQKKGLMQQLLTGKRRVRIPKGDS